MPIFKDHFASSYYDFQATITDEWDTKIDKGINFGCSASQGNMNPSFVQEEQNNIIRHNKKIDTIKGNTTPRSATDTSLSITSSAQISTALLINKSNPTGTTISLGLDSSVTSSGITEQKKGAESSSGEYNRYSKLENLINNCLSFEMEELRKLAWPGISTSARAKAWKILCRYLPMPQRNQDEEVERKQGEYRKYVEKYFDTMNDEAANTDPYRQIQADIPRMSSVAGLFQQQCVQDIFERILYIWAILHPESGYVQGMNDLVTPLFLVFLHDSYRTKTNNIVPFESFFNGDMNDIDLEFSLLKKNRDNVEADTYWCLTKVLDGIQDNYIPSQPGIHQKVAKLEDLTNRIDPELHQHLVRHGVKYKLFAVRWMNNLLTRELQVRQIVRLWDAYFAQANGFKDFHNYVCVAFLRHWKSELMKMKDFETMLTFLQNVSTANWGEKEISELAAEAYRFSYSFAEAQSHLSGSDLVKST